MMRMKCGGDEYKYGGATGQNKNNENLLVCFNASVREGTCEK
jgi:hypothetical protein